MTNDSQPRETGQAQASGLARRTFLKRAAIGAGAVGAVALVPTLAADREGASEAVSHIDESPTAGGPVVIYVRDAARGEAVIMVDDTERTVIDRALVAQLLRAQNRHLT